MGRVKDAYTALSKEQKLEAKYALQDLSDRLMLVGAVVLASVGTHLVLSHEHETIGLTMGAAGGVGLIHHVNHFAQRHHNRAVEDSREQ